MGKWEIKEVDGDFGWPSNIKDTGGRTRKKHEDPPKGMYEEVDDSGRGERGIQRS